MALPTTLTGVAFPPEKSDHGPFISSAGNVYIVLRDSVTTSNLVVHKATDPTSSCSEADAAVAPDVGAAIYSLSSFQVADVIHIATWAKADPEVRYHTFNMATDQWGTVNETVEDLANRPTIAGSKRVSIVVRSNGVPVIQYSGSFDAL